MFFRTLAVFVILTFFVATPLRIVGQTIVGTSVETKRAVFEEFGGMYCVYCPHGHEIVENLCEGLSDQLVPINYQTGPYAVPIGNDPDLGNDYSQLLQDQCELSGYPAGTVNRHVFPGLEQSMPGATALGRGNWPEAVTEIIQETAPVNIAAVATLNISTRQLELYIEYYYTADAPGETNRLHVAILQDNVLAPQHGGLSGNYYSHQHLFREYITGQWGHIISGIEAGTFGSLTYNIDLPAFYRDVWVDPVNINLAIFISEDEQEILNGVAVQPELVSEYPADANLISVIAPEDICDSYFSSEIVFRNDGYNTLNSCLVRYGIVGGDSAELNWTGQIAPLEEISLALSPLPTINGMESNEFYVEVVNPNDSADPTDYNNVRQHEFTLAPIVDGELFELALRTDEYGYELYWEVVDENGTIYASGGNQLVGQSEGGAQIATPSDPGAYESNTFFIESFFLPGSGCYQLRMMDDYADGICCYYGNGFYRLRQPGNTHFLNGGEFGAIEEKYFALGLATPTNDISAGDEGVLLYPNPLTSGDELNLSWQDEAPATFDWQLFDINGRLHQKGTQSALPDTRPLHSGYYLLQLSYAEFRLNLPFLLHD